MNVKMNKKTITIIGAGNVGATTAQLIMAKRLANVAMVDIAGDLAKGKALDIAEASPLGGLDCEISGGKDYEITSESEIGVITAGSARKPGMSREDLLRINASVIKSVTKEFIKYSPKAKIIVVTNPLDAMAYVSMKASELPRNRVLGMAGVLDSARLSFFVSQELGINPTKIKSIVLGSHGNSMVPLINHTTVEGKAITSILSKEKIQVLIDRTKKGGIEMVNLLKNGSAYYAPAASITRMVRAILKDEKEILPCSAYLKGEYGIEGCFLGVPVKLGSKGIEEIVELKLDDIELKMLNESAQISKNLIKKLED